MEGVWTRAKNPKKGNEITYHTNKRLIALFGLKSFDAELDGKPVRYYYPTNFSFFYEPDTSRKGRHITSEFSGSILEGNKDFETALQHLREIEAREEQITETRVLEKMIEAMENNRLPSRNELHERLAELHSESEKEQTEIYKMNVR